MRLIFFTSFQESYVQRSRNSLSKHEKVFQIISIVLSFEQSIEFFTFIFQGFCLNFKLTFTIFKAFMNDFQNDFRRTRHDGGFMFYIAIGYKHKTNIKVAASNNINIKMHHLFLKGWTLSVCMTIVKQKISVDLAQTCF